MAQDETKRENQIPVLDLAQNPERKFMHDVATPLSIATGQLEILLDPEFNTGPLSDVQRKRLEKVKSALERMRDMFAERRQELLEAKKKAG